MARYSRLAPTDEVTATDMDNTFRYVFSNENKGRDGHIVRNKGIQHDNYDRNNVVLFAHDDTMPPIGRGTNIDTSGVNCRIDVSFVPRDVLPFAGTIRDLVAGKWLRGLSMSWQPIQYRYLPDRSGMDFTEVDLLEVSVVPLPALANALLDARSHGVDVAPLRAWASRALDMRAYRAAPRPMLEAIHRATSGTVTSLSPRPRDLGNSRPRDNYGREELQRATEAAAVERRRRRAAILIARGKSGLTEAGQKTLESAQKSHERALRHHRVVSKHHTGVDEHIDGLRAVRRSLQAKLTNLGVEDDVSLEAFDDHLDGLKAEHESAADMHSNVGAAIKKAERCVRGVLTGAEQSEPEDDEGRDSDSKEHDSVEDRAARLRRARQIQGSRQ